MKTIVMFAVLASLCACSSPSKDPNGPTKNPSVPSNGTDESPSDPAGTPTTGDDAAAPQDSTPTNQATCVAACEVKFPKAAAENKSLDACMLGTACGAVCNDLGTSGKNFTPTVDSDAGAVCNTDKANSWAIQLHTQACADCVASHCCTLWTTIYGSTDGQGLSQCSTACFTQFKN